MRDMEKLHIEYLGYKDPLTDDEATLLLEHTEEKRIDINWMKVGRQSNHDLTNWSKLSIKDQSCIFLNKAQECTVYDYRPMNCRKLLVVTEPKFCSTVDYPKHEVSRVNHIDSEILATAVGTATEFGPMAQMLLKSKEKR